MAATGPVWSPVAGVDGGMVDARTDAEVLLEAHAFDPFPTLTQALPTEDGVPRRPLTPAERRRAKRAFRHDLRAARAERRARRTAGREEAAGARRRYRSLSRRLAEGERELSERAAEQRRARARARDVYGAIAFERMFADGICEVEEGLFSETVEFTDVSYQSASEEAQRSVFRTMSQMLDYFDPDTMVQFTLTNEEVPADELLARPFFDESGDATGLAAEFNAVLAAKVREGSSNIRRTRHVTYATSAPDAERAAVSLSRMRANVVSQLAHIGSVAHVLDGRERLREVAGILRPGRPLDFDYGRDLSPRSPLTAKDFVCPTSLDFRPQGDTCVYRSEDVWCQVLVVRPNLAAEISDRAVSDICDLPYPMVVTWHLQPCDRSRSIDLVRQQGTWIQKEIVDSQRRALRQGLDAQVLPPALVDLEQENAGVLRQILDANQHLYYFCGLVFTWARTREALDERVVEICRTAHAAGIELAALDLRQREGMNSVLPLAHNHVDVVRDLTTAEATIWMPLTTLEMDAGGGYYGQNRLSGNLVLCDRKRLMSPHGFVCGMSGSGKSFATKREIVNTVLANPGDEVFVMDVTGEYSYLVERAGGTEVVLGPDSRAHLNPLETTASSSLSPQAALTWKVDALLAMCAALRSEGGAELTQEERSVVAAAAEATYREAGDGAPTLGDFRDALSRTGGAGEAEARRLALVFSRYVSGPMGFLNHASDVTLGGRRLTSFNTSQVPQDMRTLAMLANLECVRERMMANHARGVSTWLYIDEVQSLFAHQAIIAYLARLWREGRKFGLVCTGMTQSAAAMSRGGEAASIIDQSGFLLLMRQSDADRAFWAQALSLSPQEEGYVSETARAGQGLLVADAARVPVTDDFPRDTRLYDIFSTSPEDHARRLERERGGRA